MKKIFLTGRDFVNWATDDDFNFTKKALESFVEVVDDVRKAEIIHSINWHSLLNVEKSLLQKKRVIAHIPHDVRNMLAQPEYLKIAPFVDHWVVPSTRAKFYADRLHLKCAHIPYGIDTQVFHSVANRDKLREKYHLPKDKYMIGSFQRDTEGSDLKTPKYIKGPDIFLEIVRKVFETEKNIHVVLAGPRRFWLRKKLEENGIPYTFLGRNMYDRDDILENTLNHEAVNDLYNAVDLYIVSSRLEGGPKAVLECAAIGTKIIATKVGHAEDILEKEQLYGPYVEASEMVLRDIASGHLKTFTEKNKEKISEHTIESISKKLQSLYSEVNKEKMIGIFKVIERKKDSAFYLRILDKVIPKRITVYFKFHKGPWGGGNQFLLALSKELKKRGYFVSNSMLLPESIILFNSFHVDVQKIKSMRSKLLVHRIDGPTFLIRGKDKELDDRVFSVNNSFADISVFQSSWSLFETLRLGYAPVNPVLISNASDPSVFHRESKIGFAQNRKIRLISSSWSDNPRKGGAIYKWLDENLDWTKYEYTFVGRVSEKLDHIKVIEPVPSDKLATLLNCHDIFITASDNDPCSNSVVEALSCGLPTIYYDRGGHSELVGWGGLGFDNQEEIPTLLNTVEKNYSGFQNLIHVNSIRDVSASYERVFNLVSGKSASF